MGVQAPPTTLQLLQILSLAFGLYTVVCLPIAYVWFQKKFTSIDQGDRLVTSFKTGLSEVREDIKDMSASVRQDVHNELAKFDMRLTFQKEQSERNFHELRDMLRALSEDIKIAHETALQAVHRLELFKAQMEPRLEKLEEDLKRRSAS